MAFDGNELTSLLRLGHVLQRHPRALAIVPTTCWDPVNFVAETKTVKYWMLTLHLRVPRF